MTEAKGAPPAPEEAATGFGGVLVRYYRLFVLVVLALLAHGIVSFILLPRTEDPEFDSTESRIITLYPGVEAREVETQVTRRLEDAIDELEGVHTIESTSYAGLSLIKITLSDDVQPTEVVKDIREKVRDSSKDLPEGVREPVVIVLNTAFIPVSIVSLTGPADYKLLEDWSKTLRKSLTQLEDVAAVHVEGLPERQLQVNVDNQRLSQVRVPLTRIRDILSLENAGIPAGKLDVGTRRFLLRTPNDYDSPESIGATVIGAVGESVVHLRDVATVSEGFEDLRYIVRTNRKPAVLISARKKDKTNTIAVCERIEQKVEEMRKVMPAGLEMHIINDRGKSVAQLLGGLGQEVWLGGLLVILCIWYFMGLRQALVVSISIPMCVLMTFSLMYFASIDLHQISIFGLILALGLVVDASIVVVESIEARLEAGDRLVAAVSNGVGSMAWPIASAAFTSIAAFLPMTYLPGIIGAFIRATPMTVIFALLSSLFVALCVVPLLCFAMWSRWPPVHHAKSKHQGSEKKKGPKHFDAYIRVLKFSLRHKFLTLSLAVTSFVIAIWFIPRLGIEYFPKADKQMFLINVRLPTEANIDTTDSVAREVEDLLAQQGEIRDFTANVGRGSPRVYYSEEPEDENPSYAQFIVNLKSSYEGTANAYAAKLQERLRQVSGASVQTKVLQQGPSAAAPVQLRISGDDLQVLADLARKAKESIQDVPGLVDLRDTLGDKIPRLTMVFDREKAGRLGVDTLSFARTLLMALNGEKASSFRGSEDEMPLVVRVRKGTFKEISDLTRLYVPSQSGAMVPFSEVAEVRQEQDFARIGRRDGRRSVIVQADVSGRLVNDVTREVRERLEPPPVASPGIVDIVRQVLGRVPTPAAPRPAFSAPLGYQLTIGGENEERDESFRAMGRAMMVGFLLIYAILALQFNSFVQPMVIMLTVPLGIVGSVIGLGIMGYPFDFMAFLGIVGQSGVVITDAIVLCDYANHLQRVEGTGLYEALIRAGRERMRPVLVTSATDVVGLLPPLLFGGPLWAPLATAMCFGLGLSTVLTLVVLPCMYAVLVRRKEGRRKQRLLPLLPHLLGRVLDR